MVDPKKAVAHPINCTIYAYLMLFALITIVFETKHDKDWPLLDTLQTGLSHRCSFLTFMGGRGLFYVFQGTLWLTFVNSFDDIVKLVAAGVLGFVGLLHFLGHLGIMPSQIVSKIVGEKKKATKSRQGDEEEQEQEGQELGQELLDTAKDEGLEAAFDKFDKSCEEKAKERVEEYMHIDRKGPGCLRKAGFFASLISLGAAIYTMVDLKKAIAHPFIYMIYAYLMLFALTSLLFEAEQELIYEYTGGVLDYYQIRLEHRFSFLTLMGGKGLFYIFQGTLWLTFVTSFDMVKLAAAGLAVSTGLLSIFVAVVGEEKKHKKAVKRNGA